MNINDVLNNVDMSKVSFSPVGITVNHYPDPSDIYFFTGETEDDGNGNQVQAIVLLDGSEAALQAQADRNQKQIDNLNEQAAKIQEEVSQLNQVKQQLQVNAVKEV